jgi:hypothetical protein
MALHMQAARDITRVCHHQPRDTTTRRHCNTTTQQHNDTANRQTDDTANRRLRQARSES